MRNAAPLIRARLDERLAGTGEDGEGLTLRQLKDEFAVTDRLTKARREVIAAWLEEAGIDVAPALITVDKSTAIVQLRARRVPAPRAGDVEPVPSAPSGRRQQAQRLKRRTSRFGRRAVAATVFLLGALPVVVLELPQVWDRLTPDPPAVLTGDINVAVAPLMPPPDATKDERAQIDTLSEVLHDSIRSGIAAAEPAAGLRIDLRAPSRLSPLDSAEGGQDAQELAARLRADFVIYGEVRRHGPELRVLPRFWVAPRLVQHATELTGGYAGGEPLSARDVTTNIAVRENIRRGVAARARGLAFLTIALSHYVVADYVSAERTLHAARRTAGLGGNGGRKLLALFGGNIALKRGDYDNAAARYRAALSVDPAYARARLGLAEVSYAKARGACNGRADLSGLSRAAEELRRVRADGDTPDGATALVRRRFGLARVELCRVLATAGTGQGSGLADADSGFRAVIAASDAGNELLDEAASESYGNLALMRWSFGTGARRRSAAAALELYRRAFALSRRDDRRALFLRRQAEMHDVLGARTSATAARREARRLNRLVREASIARSSS